MTITTDSLREDAERLANIISELDWDSSPYTDKKWTEKLIYEALQAAFNTGAEAIRKNIIRINSLGYKCDVEILALPLPAYGEKK